MRDVLLGRCLGLMVAVGLFGAACGSGLRAAPPKPPVVEQRGLVATEDASKVLIAGEHFKARAEVLGMKVGQLDMSVGRPCEPERDDKWKVAAKLSTAGLVRWFNKTNGESSSWLDPNKLVPVQGRTRVDDGDEVRTYRVDLKDDARFWFKYEKSNGDRKTGTTRVPDGEDFHDTQSATMLLRNWRPKPNEQAYFYVVLGRKLWRADVKNLGLEEIELGERRVKAHRYSGAAHRVKLDPGEEYTPREFSVWFTDDEQRIPIRVAGDGSIGSVTFYLEHYAKDAPCSPYVAPRAKARKKAQDEQARAIPDPERSEATGGDARTGAQPGPAPRDTADDGTATPDIAENGEADGATDRPSPEELGVPDRSRAPLPF